MFDISSFRDIYARHLHVRYQRAVRASSVLIVSRVLTALTGFITIPLVSSYMGSELFGLWMILTNAVSFLIFADFGVGVGFQNQLIRCFAQNNRNDPGIWLANSIIIMCILSLSLILTSIFIIPFLPWSEILHIKTVDTRILIVPSIQAVLYSFSFLLPINLLEYIGNAYQRGDLVYSLYAIGRLLGLLGVYIGCYYKLNLPILITIYVSSPGILYLIGFIVLLVKCQWIRPFFHGVCVVRIRQLLSVGVGMIIVRFTQVLSIQGPTVLVSITNGLAAAGVIAVAQKILTLPSIFTQPILIATQGAMAEAAHKNEWNWIKKNISRLTKLNIYIYIAVAIVLTLIGGDGLLLLLKSDTESPSRTLILLYCIYTASISIRTSYSTFLSLIDKVYVQAAYRAFILALAYFAVCTFAGSASSVILVLLLISEMPQLFISSYEANYVLNNIRLKCV